MQKLGVKIHLLLCLSMSIVLSACHIGITNTETASNGGIQKIQKSPNDKRDYRALTLSNEIKVVLVSDVYTKKSAAALAVAVGHFQNPEEFQGMAHYLEHMLFLGTEKYPTPGQYGEFLSKNGGSNNAYTTSEHTNYMFNVNNPMFEESLDRLSDFFISPKLYPEYADKEKNAVDAEWSYRRTNDAWVLQALGGIQVDTKHPAAKFPIGNLDTLKDTEQKSLHQALKDFYQQYYSANNMTLVLLSNRSLDEMEAMARRYFSQIENKNIPRPVVTVKAFPENWQQKIYHYVPLGDMNRIILDFPIPNNQKQYPMKPNYFLSYLINSEMDGTVSAVLRNKGWIDYISSAADPVQWGNEGNFRIVFQLTEEGLSHRDEIIATFFKYLKLMKERGIDEKYYTEIKKSLKNEFDYLEKKGEFEYVAQLSGDLLDYPFEHAINHPYLLDKFDPELIDNVLEHLNIDNVNVTFVGKDEPHSKIVAFFDGKYDVEPLTRGHKQKWSGEGSSIAVGLPVINTWMPDDFTIVGKEHRGKPKKIHESEYLRTHFSQSKYFNSEPKGFLKLHLASGEGVTSIKRNVAAEMLMRIYQLQQLKLLNEVSIAGYNLHILLNDGIYIRTSGFNDNQDKLLLTGLDTFMNMTVSQEDVANAKVFFNQQVDNYLQRPPISKAFDNMNNMTKINSWGWLDWKPFIDEITVKDIVSVKNALLNNLSTKLMVYGNFTKRQGQELSRQVEQRLRKVKNITGPYTRQYIAPVAGMHVVHKNDTDLTDTALVEKYVWPDNSYSARAYGAVISDYLQNRFYNQLRTQEQLGYVVSASVNRLHNYAGLVFYMQSAVKGPLDLVNRMDRFKIQFSQDLNKMTDDEFEKIKQSELVTLTQDPKNIDEELSRMQLDWHFNRFEFDSRDKLIAAVKETNLGGLQDFFKKLVVGEHGMRLLSQIRGNKHRETPFAELKDQLLVGDRQEFQEKMPRQN